MIKTVKKRKFKVTTGMTPETLAVVTDKLQHYPGVISAGSVATQISIEYALGDCNYTRITQYLADLEVPVATGSLARIKADWIRFTEDNELANLTLPAGWPQHAQNLYLSLHASDRTLTR